MIRFEKCKSKVVGRNITNYREEYDENGFINGVFFYFDDETSYGAIISDLGVKGNSVIISGVDSIAERRRSVITSDE